MILQDVVAAADGTEAGMAVAPDDGVVGQGAVFGPDNQGTLHAVVGNGHQTHLGNAIGIGECQQRAAGGRQLVVGQQAADHRKVGVVPDQRAAAGIGVAFEARIDHHHKVAAGDGRTLGAGAVVRELRGDHLGRPVCGNSAASQAGAVAGQHAVADQEFAAGVDGAAVIGRGAAAQRQAVQLQCAVDAAGQQAEGGCVVVTLQRAVAQDQRRGHLGQGIVAVLPGIGEPQRLAVQIDLVGGGIEVGACNHLAQFLDPGGIAAAGQGVREAEVQAAGGLLALEGTHVDDRRRAGTGVGNIRVVDPARVAGQVGQVAGGVAIAVEIERIRANQRVVTGIDGGAGGGQGVIPVGRVDEVRVQVDVAGAAGHATLHQAVMEFDGPPEPRHLLIAPHDGVVHGQRSPKQVAAVQIVVGEGEVGERGRMYRTDQSRRDPVAGEQQVFQADRAGGGHRDDPAGGLNGIAVIVELAVQDGDRLRAAGDLSSRPDGCTAQSGLVADKVRLQHRQIVSRDGTACGVAGAIVLKQRTAQVHRAQGNNRPAAGCGGVTAVKTHVEHVQVAIALDCQETELRSRRIAFQIAVVQRDGTCYPGQRVRATKFGGCIGTLGEQQRVSIQINQIIAAVGIGAFDRLAQLGHARGVVGTGQGVGEDKAGAGIGFVAQGEVDRRLPGQVCADGVGATRLKIGRCRGLGAAIAADAGHRRVQDGRGAGGRCAELHLAICDRLAGFNGTDGNDQRLGEGCSDDRRLSAAAVHLQDKTA